MTLSKSPFTIYILKTNFKRIRISNYILLYLSELPAPVAAAPLAGEAFGYQKFICSSKSAELEQPDDFSIVLESSDGLAINRNNLMSMRFF